jgi:small GTP-binding protein
MAACDDGGSDYKAKVVIVGDGAIGKTCLLKRMTTDTDSSWEEFGETYEATTFGQQQLVWEDDEGSSFSIELWDTAGQEALENLREMSYPNTDVIVVGYNCTDLKSLQNISYIWVPEFQAKVGENCYKIVAGTKVDMRAEMSEGDESSVDTDSAQDKAVEIGAVEFIETSAKTCQGINTLKMMICAAIKAKAEGIPCEDEKYIKPEAKAEAAPAPPKEEEKKVKEVKAAEKVESDYHKKLEEHHEEEHKKATEKKKEEKKAEEVPAGHKDEPDPTTQKQRPDQATVANEDSKDSGGCKCTLL